MIACDKATVNFQTKETRYEKTNRNDNRSFGFR